MTVLVSVNREGWFYWWCSCGARGNGGPGKERDERACRDRGFEHQQSHDVSDMNERIVGYHADRAAAVAEELARNLRARNDPRFGSRVLEESLEVSLPALEYELRAAVERVDVCASPTDPST